MSALLLQGLDRRVFVGTGIAWLACCIAADARAVLSAQKLESLIQLALRERDITPVSRPAILGFTESKLETRSIEDVKPDEKHGFMVVIPRRDDGLLIFRGAEKPVLFFAIHRTGMKLSRIASAINRDGKLTSWSGADADADFAKQLAHWAAR